MNKSWWKSKTLWLNTLVAIGTVVEANFGLLQAKVGPQSYLVAAGLIAGANFVLRTITTQPLGKGDPQ